jgi:bifunctional non-homologous end joining protein LigD
MAQVLFNDVEEEFKYMSLSLYKKKRNFSDTPEPEGKGKSSAKGLRFVIQKHDASSLHYDFRLEMKGVLKSWAVPKGPSLNPADKRLAMMVEDHPYDYRTFEGIIPEGNYGGGTVIVWDEGYYEPMEADGLSKEEQEKLLLKQLYGGDLKIHMKGKKIKGNYALFRLKRDEKSWLLVKKNDEFASEEEVILQNKSVKSGKTLAEVAAKYGVEVKHPEQEVSSAKRRSGLVKTAPKKAAVKKTANTKTPKAATKSASRKKKAST